MQLKFLSDKRLRQEFEIIGEFLSAAETEKHRLEALQMQDGNQWRTLMEGTAGGEVRQQNLILEVARRAILN